MPSPLTASAQTAAAMFASSTFRIPAYQREYAWTDEEIQDFWNDLSNNLDDDYFLGLIILTENADGPYDVVDGQQRLLTVTLLAIALHSLAEIHGRKRLADRIQADFLKVLDFDTDEVHPRVVMTDPADNKTLQALLDGSGIDSTTTLPEDLSRHMIKAYRSLRTRLSADTADDAFKRLGAWTDFLTSRLYFAKFVHRDAASAYRVFEVVNTRGRGLTTADLLKNYVMGRTSLEHRDGIYRRWKELSDAFDGYGEGAFVTFIRFVATQEAGYLLPKGLYDYLSGRFNAAEAWSPSELLNRLEEHRALYMQMIDPSLEGPADAEALRVYESLNELGIVAARPALMALHATEANLEGSREVLRLIVRRIVVGNLTSGSIERRLSEAALALKRGDPWSRVAASLRDLATRREDFERSASANRFNKNTLSFLRRSVVQATITPEDIGTLHFVRPRRSDGWGGWTSEQSFAWETTLGNTLLAEVDRRPQGATTWQGFREKLLPAAVPGEWAERLEAIDEWTPAAVTGIGAELGRAGGSVWYD